MNKAMPETSEKQPNKPITNLHVDPAITNVKSAFFIMASPFRSFANKQPDSRFLIYRGFSSGQFSDFIVGKSSTSRMAGELVSSITSLSIP